MIAWLIAAAAVASHETLPVIRVERDNVVIDRSCRLEIAGPIADADGNGVIQITGDAIVVEGADQRLHGGTAGQAPETFAGYGVRITGRRVKLRNLKVSGYRGGIFASGAHGLELVGCDVSNNFRQKLLSTPEAENLADWLYPHENDGNEWLHKWGAGIYLEETRKAVVRNCFARDGQNGLCLRDVHESKIYDNDFSFLSGWGVALFRSNRNVISHNALDFCIRGYSHDVYSRGQDSAGILLFEQCSENVIGFNSATHGGDGFFGFGGQDALEAEAAPGVGCNRNLIFSNDFSDSAANAIEITFSFGNVLVANVLDRGNYGIWGGYSSRCIALNNQVRGNHIAGIAIEHGDAWQIRSNNFVDNPVGVKLWWDDDRDLLAKPWSKLNPTDCHDHVIALNHIERSRDGIDLRGGATAGGLDNTFVDVATAINLDPQSKWTKLEKVPPVLRTVPQVPGDSRPVGMRDHLAGRAQIIMTPYGPYDHDGPFARRRIEAAGTHLIDVFGDERPQAVEFDDVGAILEPLSDQSPGAWRIRPREVGVPATYTLSFQLGDERFRFAGTVSTVTWSLRAFRSPVDPREDYAAWKAAGEQAPAHEAIGLDLPLGSRGPGDLGLGFWKDAGLPRDGFGTIATTTVRLTPGHWRLRTLSDDGVRAWVDDALLIDNWTHHGPTPDEAGFEVDTTRDVRIRIEHFELDGYAILQAELLPADGTGSE